MKQLKSRTSADRKRSSKRTCGSRVNYKETDSSDELCIGENVGGTLPSPDHLEGLVIDLLPEEENRLLIEGRNQQKTNAGKKPSGNDGEQIQRKGKELPVHESIPAIIEDHQKSVEQEQTPLQVQEQEKCLVIRSNSLSVKSIAEFRDDGIIGSVSQSISLSETRIEDRHTDSIYNTESDKTLLEEGEVTDEEFNTSRLQDSETKSFVGEVNMNKQCNASNVLRDRKRKLSEHHRVPCEANTRRYEEQNVQQHQGRRITRSINRSSQSDCEVSFLKLVGAPRNPPEASVYPRGGGMY